MVGSRSARGLGCLFGIHALASLVMAQVPLSETLLPGTATKAWVSAPKFVEMTQHWDQTQFGKLLNSPMMKPFRLDFDEQIQARRKARGEQIGMTLDDLRKIAGGEVCLAQIQLPKRRPSRMALVDVTGKLPATRALMTRLRMNQLNQGAKRTQMKIGDTTVNIYKQGGKVQMADFLRGNLFCAGRDDAVVIDILKRHLDKAAGDLASFEPYVQVRKRLLADNALARANPKATPHLRWFMQPIGFAEAQRILNPLQNPDEELDMLAVAKKTGFKAMLGAGGFMRFNDAAPYDTLHRIAVYAPKPWVKSMKMLSFVNDGGLKANDDRWVPANLATHMTGSVELLKAFEFYGPIFDEVVSGGKKGVWPKTIDAIRDDALGPRVDIREEIIKRLTVVKKGRFVARCTVITDNGPPQKMPNGPPQVMPDSGRQLFAVKIQPTAAAIAKLGRKQAEDNAEKALRTTLIRYYQPDVNKGLAIYRKKVVPGIEFWELLDQNGIVNEKKAPALNVVVGDGGKGVKVNAPEAEKPKSSAVCVTHGLLLRADHVGLMIKVLRHIKGNGLPLSIDSDYQTAMKHIDRELKQRKWANVCIRRFSRTDESISVDYELARSGRLDMSESMFGQLLSEALQSAVGGGGKPLNFGKLPQFGATRRFLRPSGMFVHDETNGEAVGVNGWCGWFIVSFSLK